MTMKNTLPKSDPQKQPFTQTLNLLVIKGLANTFTAIIEKLWVCVNISQRAIQCKQTIW